MLSKTLTKLVDEAILPAVILVAAKVLGVIIVNSVLNLRWSLKGISLVYYSGTDYLAANSYSTLIMFGAILLFTLWVLLKSHLWHDSHVSPATSAKLVDRNLIHLIQSSFELYTQATVWLSYSLLTTLILGIMAVSSLIFTWIFYVALVLTVLTLVLLLLDVERELSIKKESQLFYA
ncbi:MAG: hypothetical protein NT141_04050 [candidate division WWE3 bacterium]|nr:hypothetical protein [candidate division WWE3 bacterium]